MEMSRRRTVFSIHIRCPAAPVPAPPWQHEQSMCTNAAGGPTRPNISYACNSGMLMMEHASVPVPRRPYVSHLLVSAAQRMRL